MAPTEHHTITVTGDGLSNGTLSFRVTQLPLKTMERCLLFKLGPRCVLDSELQKGGSQGTS